MRNHRFVLYIGVAAWLLAGCASQGCFKYYSKNSVTETTNRFPLSERSNINVIRFSSFPSGGVNAFPKNVVLGYYVDRQLQILDRHTYQAFQVNWRLYLFNLPPNTYYILSVIPDVCRPSSTSDTINLLSDNDDIMSFNKNRQWSDNETIDFNEVNYQAYPLKIGNNRFNLLGQYRIHRDIFSSNGKLSFVNELDEKEETQYFHNLVKETCKWRKLVGLEQ